MLNFANSKFYREHYWCKFFQHRSQGSLQEIFLTIGDTMGDNLLEKVQKASCFGILIDDLTDITVK